MLCHYFLEDACEVASVFGGNKVGRESITFFGVSVDAGLVWFRCFCIKQDNPFEIVHGLVLNRWQAECFKEFEPFFQPFRSTSLLSVFVFGPQTQVESGQNKMPVHIIAVCNSRCMI